MVTCRVSLQNFSPVTMAGASASMTVEADLSSTARRPRRTRVHRKASLVRDAEHYFRLPSYFTRKASLTFADVKRTELELFSTPPPCLTPTLRDEPVSYRHIIACPNYQRHRGNADAMRSRSLTRTMRIANSASRESAAELKKRYAQIFGLASLSPKGRRESLSPTKSSRRDAAHPLPCRVVQQPTSEYGRYTVSAMLRVQRVWLADRTRRSHASSTFESESSWDSAGAEREHSVVIAAPLGCVVTKLVLATPIGNGVSEARVEEFFWSEETGVVGPTLLPWNTWGEYDTTAGEHNGLPQSYFCETCDVETRATSFKISIRGSKELCGLVVFRLLGYTSVCADESRRRTSFQFKLP